MEAEILNSELIESKYLQSVLEVSQEKMRSIDGLPGFLGYFFTDNYTKDDATHATIFKKGDPVTRIREALNALAALEDFSEASLERALNDMAQTHGQKIGSYLLPLRYAVSGVGVGPSLYSVLRVLGKDRVINRLETFIATQ
jgi:glutamyl/glutaminyl-tRNA synthetase